MSNVGLPISFFKNVQLNGFKTTLSESKLFFQSHLCCLSKFTFLFKIDSNSRLLAKFNLFKRLMLVVPVFMFTVPADLLLSQYLELLFVK